jgi:predicted porin
MGGLTVAAAIVPGENNAADGLADAYSVGAMYSNSGFYASAAIEGGDKEIDYLSTRGLNDYEQTRVGLGYDSGSWKVSGVWGNIDVENQVDQDIYTVSGAYSFGNNTLKAKYFDATDSHDGFAVGFDHALSKRTKAYALYTAADYEDNAGDKDIWGIGVNHAF